MSAPHPVELRVLSGPQAGARLLLQSGSSVDVGSVHALGCQVVLIDSQVCQQRLRLHVLLQSVRIEVLAGDIELNGQQMVAPCALDWPSYMPMKIGQTVLAVGFSGSESGPQWPQAVAPIPARQDPLQCAGPLASQSAITPKRYFALPIALGGAAITTVAISWLVLVLVSGENAAPQQSKSAYQQAQKILQAPEFQGLHAEVSDEDQLVISGDVRMHADRARLERTLSPLHTGSQVQLHVRVGEAVAQAVRDVYRMNGLASQTEMPSTLADVGTVRVRTQEGDMQRLQRTETAARRDVAGLTELHVVNAPPLVVRDAVAVVDDPGKRVASIVSGAVPYVVTADGTRYFLGALLPSGHRLASIAEQQVMLDKEGKLTTLRF
jgi:type III secretion protein D